MGAANWRHENKTIDLRKAQIYHTLAAELLLLQKATDLAQERLEAHAAIHEVRLLR